MPKKPQAKQPKAPALPIGGLTALRGIAAIYVTSYHWFWDFGFGFAPPRGYLAVDFFFILSGFILMHTYGHLFVRDFVLRDYAYFLWRRLMRIYPVHAISTLVLVPILFFTAPDFYFNWRDLVPNLLLIHTWLPGLSMKWNFVSWSISAEWACYLLFPCLCAWVKPNTTATRLIIIALLCVWLLQLLALFTPPHSIDITGRASIVRALCGFVFGMVLYLAYQRYRIRLPADRGMLYALAALPFIYFLPYIYQPFILCFFAVILLAATTREGVSGKVLNSRPFVFLGDISLSIYLLQYPVVLALKPYFKFLLFFTPESLHILVACFNGFVYYSVLIAVSWYMYRFIENPFRRLARRKKTA